MLSVSADGKRTFRGTVNAAGALASASQYKEGVDGELDWVEVRPAALKKMARSGIPA